MKTDMLELDDIQHFLLTRPRARVARYGFLTFRQPDQGRAWLSGIIDIVGTGKSNQSLFQSRASLRGNAASPQRLRRDGLDRGKSVFHPMAQLV